MNPKLIYKATACNIRAILKASMTKEAMGKFCTSSQQRSRFSTAVVSKNKNEGINPGDAMSFSLKTHQLNVDLDRKINWTNCFFHYRGAEDNDPTSKLQTFQPFCDITKNSTGSNSESRVWSLKNKSSLTETIKQGVKECYETKKLPSWLSKVPLPVSVAVIRTGYQIYQEFNKRDSGGDDKSSGNDKEASNEGDIDLSDSHKKETGDQEVTDDGMNSGRSEDNFSAAENCNLDGKKLDEKAQEVWEFMRKLFE